jgi:glycosyltransferase involved in cell wall biosynthesis
MLVANGYAPDPRVHKEARTLMENGYSVSVLCWDRERNRRQTEVIDGVLVRRFRYLFPRDLASFFVSGCLFLVTCLFVLINEGARQERVVVHCHDLNTLPLGLLVRSLSRKYRIVYDSHESFPELVMTIAPKVVAAAVRAVERFMLARVDALIAANDVILQYLQRYSKVPGVAIYNTPPLDVSQLAGLEEKNEISRLKEESGGDTFVLLYYGAILQHRGLHALLDAADMASESSSPKLIFLVVGDGPLAASLHLEAQQRKLAHRVRFYSHVSFGRAMCMVKAADAVYIGFEPDDPNNYFASPNKLFEAMAMGTPVLASGFGFLGKLVQTLGCGITMKSITGPSILAGVQRLLHRDVRKSCVANGLYWFKSYYNWDVMARRLSEIYKDIAPIPCTSVRHTELV